MNKSEIRVMKCKQVAGHNIKCFAVLTELIDAGREDLVDEIIKAMNINYQILTPEQIVNTYNACGGKDGFVKRCNKIFNKRTLKREQREYEYEEALKEYNCGERKDHPDGTKFEKDGTEINYD